MPLFVFDLDDTLYSERSYVYSALRYAGDVIKHYYGLSLAAESLIRFYNDGVPDPIGAFWKEADLPETAKAQMVAAMRAHLPAISLRPGAVYILAALQRRNLPFAILTDGRSITQRAKIAALGCSHSAYISISEEVGYAKTNPLRFQQIAAHFQDMRYLYVGDNPAKDFLVPNSLGWTTVMLTDDGDNIHSQHGNYGKNYCAHKSISDLQELERFIDGVD